jgi:hypothetical protein
MPSTSTFYQWLDSNTDKAKQLTDIIKNIPKIDYRNIKGSKALSINDYRNKNARKINSLKFPNSNLYIIKIKNYNLYKIGVSQNTNRRFKDIFNSMPFDCEIIYNQNQINAYLLEEKLHNLIINNHVKNEWFKLDNIDLILNEIKEWVQ